MSESKTVKMIADLGTGAPINAGHCHPSQARILVKKDLAQWQDGKLLLRLRPVHLVVAANHPKMETDDPNVSQAEIDRRQEWFRSILRGVVDADTHGSDLGTILGYHLREGKRELGPREVLEHIQRESNARQEHNRRLLADMRGQDGLRDPEDDHWYEDDEEDDGVLVGDLVALWTTAPDLEHVFGKGLKYDPPHQGIGRSNPDYAIPVYRPEDAANGGIILIPVPFQKMARSEETRKRDGTFMEKNIQRKCPTCGLGTDSDGDGNCGMCYPSLRQRR